MISPDQKRYEADPDRIAILLPGGGWYTSARPLLHFARGVLLRHGWTVQEVWWRPPMESWNGLDQAEEWVEAEVRQVLSAESAGRVLLVGKSLGTFASRLAAERGLPAIWLTPVLNDERVVSALTAATAPALLVGGTADSMWVPEVARGSGHTVLEIPDAHHGMEIDDDPVRSAGILREVVVAMDEFVAAL
ncbi:hypothetical protein [Flindersiella endophytica]